MKKGERWIVIGIFILVGLSIGLLFSLEDPSASEEQGVEMDYLKEIEALLVANEGLRERMQRIREEIREVEENLPGENIALLSLRQEVRRYQSFAGLKEMEGPGIEIKLSGRTDGNIAPIIEGNKYLINLLNELRTFGGEGIEVNGHRIVTRSEVTLAGSHINVNGTPIAPPYTIKVIGNPRTLTQYVEYNTFIFDMMEEDGILTEITFLDQIKIAGHSGERPYRYFEPIE